MGEFIVADVDFWRHEFRDDPQDAVDLRCTCNVYVGPDCECTTEYDTLDAAKAGAEQHYRQLVLSMFADPNTKVTA